MKKLLLVTGLTAIFQCLGFAQIPDSLIDQYWVFRGDSNGNGPEAASMDSVTFPLIPPRFASATVGDLDGDGDMDFISGNNRGSLFYYENIGTPTSPNWRGPSNAIPSLDTIKIGKLQNTNETRPELIDMDDDGDLDLFVGSRWNYMGLLKLDDIHYYENIGDATNPIFQYNILPGIAHQQVGEFSNIGMVDIDDDGDLDMFSIGSDSCTFLLNIGTKTNPMFERQFGADNPCDAWSYTGALVAQPDFEDFDQDGDFDIYFQAEDGMVYYIINNGTASSPDFDLDNVHLVHSMDTVDVGAFGTADFADVTGDGVKDIIMTHWNPGAFFWYEGIAKCGAASTIPTAAGTYTSTTSSIAGDWVNYCDDNDNLLLSLKVGDSGAVVGDNEVMLKISSPTAVHHSQGCGSAIPPCFIDLADGAVIFQREWDVNPTTQPSSGNVGVRFYYTQVEYDAVNTELDNQGQAQLTNMDEMWFYKITNGALGQFPTITNIAAGDVVTLGNDGSTPGLYKWELGTKTSGSEFFAEYEVSSFSGGGGGGAAAGAQVLPIELLFFHAYADGENVQLKWSTSSEKDNEGFEIQRSKDGHLWENLSFVKGAGNTFSRQDYRYTDTRPQIGQNYYRLKQMDWDGKFEYLPIQVVDMKNSDYASISVYPTPANDVLHVTNVQGKGMIYNVSGQFVKAVQLNEEGINTIAISELQKGMYQLLIIPPNGETIVRRFLK